MVTPSEMKPGQYILTRDVKNPRPDRRQRYDWRAQETWEKGTEFTVQIDKTIDTFTALRIFITWGRYEHMCLYLHNTENGQVPALLAALEPAPRTGARDLRAISEVGSRLWFRLLARMLDAKEIDLEQVKGWIEKLDAEDEAAWKAQQEG